MVNYNLDVTLDYAREKFKAMPAETMALKSGSNYDNEAAAIYLNYLGDNYRVTYPEGEVTYKDKNGDVDIKVKVLLLHYLSGASGLTLVNRKISFKEVPGGDIYIDPFNKRSVLPFIKIFGERPEEFKKVATMLGGTEQKMGDFSFDIPVFTKVPVTFVLWLGDDEFPANGTILFDASATSYLPTEDFAVIAQFTVFKMKELLAQI